MKKKKKEYKFFKELLLVSKVQQLIKILLLEKELREKV